MIRRKPEIPEMPSARVERVYIPLDNMY